MRILYVAERINAADGSSVHCRAFVDHAVKLGHDVRTYPPIKPQTVHNSRPTPAEEKNLWYYCKKLNWPLIRSYLHRSNPYLSELLGFVEGQIDSLIQANRLKRLLSHFHADVIIYRYRLFNSGPYHAAKNSGLPIVSEINSLKMVEVPLLKENARPTVLTRQSERQAIKNSNIVICVSENLKGQIERIQPSVSVRVVANGVDTNKFNPRRFEAAEVKAALGLSNKFVIGYTGSYQNWHGLNRTLEVAKRLKEHGGVYHFLLIGYGAGYHAIERKIQALSLEDMFTQIKTLPHDEIPYHLMAFDCALMTYPAMDEFYFSPLKMFEYMAMEIPVLSTAVGQISEILEHGKDGLLVEDPTPDNFAATLLQYRTNLKRIGKEGRLKVERGYSWHHNAERVVDAAASAAFSRADHS